MKSYLFIYHLYISQLGICLFLILEEGHLKFQHYQDLGIAYPQDYNGEFDTLVVLVSGKNANMLLFQLPISSHLLMKWVSNIQDRRLNETFHMCDLSFQFYL